ncbi:MAG TPA: GatB/YqeY domain-containing protein [Gammaproteobacteria bacterium]|nr:GatB/YqeY domain-containing protein [Gammaproteobacteria bacterium]
MTGTKERLQEDVKAALRAGNKVRLGVLRMVMAAIKQREVDTRETLDDVAVLAVLEKMVKQRQEAITQFERGGRGDLVAKESAEIDVIREFLPKPLDAAGITALLDAAIAATGATTVADMGRVMAEVKQAAAGRADMAELAKLVRARLGAR